MKKIGCFLLSLLLLFSFTACDSTTDSNESNVETKPVIANINHNVYLAISKSYAENHNIERKDKKININNKEISVSFNPSSFDGYKYHFEGPIFPTEEQSTVNLLENQYDISHITDRYIYRFENEYLEKYNKTKSSTTYLCNSSPSFPKFTFCDQTGMLLSYESNDAIDEENLNKWITDDELETIARSWLKTVYGEKFTNSLVFESIVQKQTTVANKSYKLLGVKFYSVIAGYKAFTLELNVGNDGIVRKLNAQNLHLYNLYNDIITEDLVTQAKGTLAQVLESTGIISPELSLLSAEITNGPNGIPCYMIIYTSEYYDWMRMYITIV